MDSIKIEPRLSPPIKIHATTSNMSATISDTATTIHLSSANNELNSAPTVCFSLPHVQHTVLAQSPSPTNPDDLISDEEARRRRELLARRPSYRKILNDLSGVELDLRHKDSGDSGGDSSEDSNTSESTMTGSQAGMPSSTLGGPATDAINYAAFIPHGALHLTTSANGDLSVGGLLPPGTAPSLLQYPIQDGGPQQILVPMSGNDLLGLKPVIGGSTSSSVAALVSQGLINFSSPGGIGPSISSSKASVSSQGHFSSSGSGSSGGGGTGDNTTQKRELRLLKNREAAKECRRKKKEYVKCLENRVTVLEAQNKQLIEELRALKELYCRKAD